MHWKTSDKSKWQKKTVCAACTVHCAWIAQFFFIALSPLTLQLRLPWISFVHNFKSFVKRVRERERGRRRERETKTSIRRSNIIYVYIYINCRWIVIDVSIQIKFEVQPTILSVWGKIVKRRKSESCIPYIVSYEWAKFALCINLSSFLYEFQSKVRLNYVRRCLNVIEFRKIFIPIKATTKKNTNDSKNQVRRNCAQTKNRTTKKKEKKMLIITVNQSWI